MARSRTPRRRADLPYWNADRGELTYCGHLVKHFDQKAKNQKAILAAFQEEGWPERIDDPLPQDAVDAKERLHDAIKNLNRHQAAPLIHFRGDSTGEGVLWEPTGGLPQRFPSGRKKRR